MKELVYRAFFPFGGAGAGARGFQDAERELPGFGVRARFEVVGGIDFDAGACKDFEYLTGVPQLCASVETLTPADLLRVVGARAPDCVFFSPPCKAASGLLSAKKAQTEKYQQMNMLALVWVRLMLATWDEPPPLLLLENVPRLATRAAPMLKELRRLLKRAGYVLTDGYHDCGELGGLAQHRRRFLLVARHPRRCPPVLYQPPKRRVRGCGDVLSQLPVPGTVEALACGKMHELPKIAMVNWIRLALIPAGGDHRDLNGVLADGQARREVFKRHAMEEWNEPVGTISGSGSNGVANIADPRPATWGGGRFGVNPWGAPAGTVTGQSLPNNGRFAVADPRLLIPQPNNPNAHHGKYRIAEWDEPVGTVIGATRVGSGALSVADLRVKRAYDAGYGVLKWGEPSRTIATKTSAGCGAYAVADVRLGCEPRAGAYGVLRWADPAKTVTGSLGVDNGFGAVADPRKAPPFLPVIIADDGTWHRPLTTLELAALQGFPLVVNGKPLQLHGSHTKQREHIGNAVPVPAARAIAESMLVALAEGTLGTFSLSGEAVWVTPEGEAIDGRC